MGSQAAAGLAVRCRVQCCVCAAPEGACLALNLRHIHRVCQVEANYGLHHVPIVVHLAVGQGGEQRAG